MRKPLSEAEAEIRAQRERMLREALGKTVARRRDELGVSQRSLSGSIGMSNAHLRSIEKGGTDPSFTTLDRIASALGTDVAELARDAYGHENVTRTDL